MGGGGLFILIACYSGAAIAVEKEWRKQIEFGNAGKLDTNGTGWFIGFSDWARSNVRGGADLRFMEKNSLAHTLHTKWMEHPKDDPRGKAKPPSEGRTLSILVSEKGKFRLEFSAHQDFPADQVVTHTLQQHGDFVIWGENLHHRWFVEEKCAVLTFRWVPVS